MAPKTRLWLLLVVSSVFVVLGFIITLIGPDWRLGLGNVGFFGVAVFIFALQLGEYAKLERPHAPLQVKGGVPVPQSRKRRLLFVIATGVSGMASMLIGFERNLLLWWIGVGLVVLASAYGAWVALGRLGRDAIVFLPDGLHFMSSAGRYVLHFDNLAQVDTVDANGHLVLRLMPVNVALVVASAPEHQREVLAKKLSESTAFFGVPLTLTPSQFDLDPRAVTEALARWVREPATRDELKL